MNLLIVSEDAYPGFDALFEETTHVPLEAVAPEVIDSTTDVKVEDQSITAYDAVFLDIPVPNAVFARVLLETIEDKGLPTNYPSTAFFVMAKKNYLYYVLHDKHIPAPKTVSLATDKAARNLERELDPPVIGRKLEDLEETEAKKLESNEEMLGFAEGSEYQEDILLFQEYRNGDRYRVFVAGDQMIALKDDAEGWRFGTDNLKFANISADQKAVVQQTVDAIGAPVAEVLLRDDRVYDLNPNPDLELYTDVSGKNAYEAVAAVLKEETR